MAQENVKNINNHKDEGQSDIQTNEALIPETEAQAPTADTQNETHGCCTGECGHCFQKCKVHNNPSKGTSSFPQNIEEILSELEKLSGKLREADDPDIIRGLVLQIAEIVHNTQFDSTKEAFIKGNATRTEVANEVCKVVEHLEYQIRIKRDLKHLIRFHETTAEEVGEILRNLM